MATAAGGNRPAYRQAVEQNSTDSLKAQLLVEGESATLTSATVTIYSPSGSALVTDAACSVLADVATYSVSWAEATYSRDFGYRAAFALISGGVTYSLMVYFEVVRRRFTSQLDKDMIEAIHPYIGTLSLSTLEPYMTAAWAEIERYLRGKFAGQYPGNLFHPERFIDAHLWGTLERFFYANALSGNANDMDVWKYTEAKENKYRALSLAESSLDFDLDDDGQIDDDERGLSYSGIELAR